MMINRIFVIELRLATAIVMHVTVLFESLFFSFFIFIIDKLINYDEIEKLL